MLATDNVPLISYSATSPSLSNKHTYPSFLRTVPSDLSQVFAIGDLASHLNWTYVSLLGSDDEYGRMAMVKLRDTLRQKGICFAVDRLFDPNFITDDSSSNTYNNNNSSSNHQLKQITDSLKAVYDTSKVVILWADLDTALRIIGATQTEGISNCLFCFLFLVILFVYKTKKHSRIASRFIDCVGLVKKKLYSKIKNG